MAKNLPLLSVNRDRINQLISSSKISVAVFALMFLLSATSVITRKLLNNKGSSLERVKLIAHELELLIMNATTSVSPIRIELDCLTSVLVSGLADLAILVTPVQ